MKKSDFSETVKKKTMLKWNETRLGKLGKLVFAKIFFWVKYFKLIIILDK